MMKPKKVILWGREDLLGRAVEFFLTIREKCEVIRVPDQQGLEALTQQLEAANPEVVILYQGDCASGSDLPLQLMQSRSELKVITFSLENNSLEIYNKQKVWVRNVADLLSIVEG